MTDVSRKCDQPELSIWPETPIYGLELTSTL